MLPVTTTLKAIRAAGPCENGWRKLLNHLGKSKSEAKHDETPLPVETVLDSNGLDDALWVLDNVGGNNRLCRLFAADCAERVLHIFEAERPDDDRPRKAIATARDPDATEEQSAAAWAAAGAAAWEATRSDTRAAARAAAWAAEDAALAGAENARDAAWHIARAGAWDVALEVQKTRIRQYLQHGEAAAQMPWPEPVTD